MSLGFLSQSHRNFRYVVRGGMQDYNYDFHDCLELTLELSCCKYPTRDALEKEWNDNKESLISFLEAGGEEPHLDVFSKCFSFSFFRT